VILMQDEKFNEESDQEEKVDKTTKKAKESVNQSRDNVSSKRKGTKSERNYLKMVGRVAVVLLLLGVLASGIAGYYMFNLGVNAKSDKGVIFENNRTYSLSLQRLNNFFQTQKYKDRYIENEGLRLHAYDFNQGSDTYIINVHGYASEGLRTGVSSKWFYDKGYNVLAVDCRGHGKSEGDYIGMGWLDRKDLVAWVNQLVKENPKVKIILFGVSMGGAAVMDTTGEKLPPNVQLAIEDSGYTTAWDVFARQMNEIFGLPSFPIMNSANLITKLKAGYNLRDGSIKQVKKAKIPTLYIHGTADNFAPFEMLDKIFEASSAPDKEKLVIQGVGHNEGMFKQPDLYWRGVNQFINKHHKSG
jgi:uncharacterized protein